MTYFRRLILNLSLLALCLLVTSQAWAQAPSYDQTGPTSVKLGDDLATLTLPQGFGFMAQAKIKALIEKSGGNAKDVLGFVGSTNPADKYGILISYEDTGYVEDKDGDKLNADEILKNIKEGTEAQNEERQKHGTPPLHVLGWDQAPSYDKGKHLVVWSIRAKNDQEEAPIVNFNTRMLGRKGVLEVNLICDQSDLQKYKPEVGKVLDAVTYNTGNKYTDYKSGDKMAAGGIAALIVGGLILKKGGLLAILFGLFKPLLAFGAKIIAVCGKFIVFVVAGFVSGIKRLFGIKKKEEVVAVEPPDSLSNT